MAKKISDLTAASAFDGTELFEVVQTSSKKGLLSAVATYILGTGLNAQSAASVLAGTERIAAYQSGGKYLTPAQIAAYLNTLVVGDVHTRLLWKLIGADMNSTADQALTKVGTFTSFVLCIAPGLVNPSTSLTTAAGGIYSATSKGGDALVASTQVYSAANAAGAGVNITRSVLGQGLRSDAALYLSLTTPQGAPATGDLRLYGIPLS